MHSIYRNLRRNSLLSILSLSLLVACQPSPVNQTQIPNSQSTSATSSSSVPVLQKPPVKGKTFFGIYMVGSDLEDDIKPRNGISDEEDTGAISTRGSGSNDLRELIEGWKQLTPAHQATLDILVAFGGARKQGWKGIKYATMPCLIEDSQDNYFGNATCYQQVQAEQNLSQLSSLSQFLKIAKERSQGHERVILDLWDHGAAFMGMGHDTNHEESNLISLPDIQKAFEENQVHVDMLGFDACLMASLEVARSLQPYADYMLASQELEPGHGWQYTDWVTTLASETDVTSIGKKMVDSFITHPLHQRTRNKTLSLTDLRKIPALLGPLDQFIAKLPANTPVPVLPSLQATPEFGVQSRGGVAYTIDLREFINNITHYQPELKTDGQVVLDQVAQSIVYSREDGSKPGVGGITIFSMNKDLKPEYNQDQSVSRTFLNFVDQWLATQASATTAPSIQTEGLSVAQVVSGGGEVAVPECRADDGRVGQCVTVQAEKGASVERVFALQTDQGIEILGRERLLPLDLAAQRYFSERWNGYWFKLCDGSCDTGTSLTPPAIYSHTMQNGHRIYVAEAELNRLPVDLYLELDPVNAQVITYWIVPQADTSHAVPVPSRLDLELSPGDQLAFVSYFLQADGSVLKKTGASMQFSSNPVWQYLEIPPSRGRRVYLTRATAAATTSASYTSPISAAASNAPLQSPIQATIPAATSMEIAPSSGTVGSVGEKIKPNITLKDATGQSVVLPLTYRSLTAGFEVATDGTVTYTDGSVGFGSILVTEPISGITQQWNINASRGGGGGSTGPSAPSPAWSLLSAPVSGQFTAITSNAAGTTLFAASGKSLYRSSNGGNSWTFINSAISTDPNALVNTVLVDPNDSNTLYAAVDTSFNPAVDAGVFRSTDGGANWTRVDTGLPNASGQNEVLQLLLDSSTTPTMLYAGVDGAGVYASNDGGTTWSSLNNAPLAALTVKGMAFVPGSSNPQALLVGTQFGGGVYQSVNANAVPASVVWTDVSGDLNTCNPGNFVSELMAISNTEWIAGVSGGGRVCRTTNGGTNWTQIDTGIPGSITQPNYLAYDPNNTAILYAAFNSNVQIPEGIYQSTNSGTTWSAVNTGLPILDVFSLTRDAGNPAEFWLGLNGGGLYSSTNPATGWTLSDISTSNIRGMAVNPNNSSIVYAATLGGGVFQSLDAGSNWTAINNGLIDLFVVSLAIDPNNPNTLYAMTRDNGLFQSTDGGANWVSVLSGVGSASNNIGPVVVAPSDSQIVYVATALGLYQSIDGGATFNVLSELQFDNITAIAVDPNDANIVYASSPTTAPPGPTTGGLIKSIDGGVTWSEPPVHPELNYTSIVIDPNNSQRIYATTATNFSGAGTGIYVSEDGGTTWASLNTGLPELDIQTLAIDPSRTQYLYAGTNTNGVYFSSNRGVSWSAFNTAASLTAPQINVLVTDPNVSQRVYAGTASRGVLKNR